MVSVSSQPKPLQIRFSVFEVNLSSRELFKHGIRVKIQKQPFEILCALLERPGEVVSREELRQRLWPEDTFVEYEDSLNTAVRKLRAALSDSSDLPRYIETVARQGYRFVGPVQPIPIAPANAGGDVASELPANENASGGSAPARGHLSHYRRVIFAGISALLIAALAGWAVWSHSPAPKPLNGRVMLAVLPFENLTGDASQDYFSDGLTEEMITRLGNLNAQHLGVIARTSVMHYKNTQTPLSQIGRELGVQYAIEGSVRRDSNNIRITAQLIQVKDQTHIWARQYDRELKDLLVLQGEIAQEIADETQSTFDKRKTSIPVQPSLSPQRYEAYNLYLKGQYFLNKRSITGLEEAIGYFQQAAAKDPTNARAYAGLADSYALMGGYSARPQEEFATKARAAALQALAIDDNLPEAHAVLALIVQNNDWDWQTAEKEYRRAIDLNPNYATAHQWYAEHLMWRGRFDEAFRESEWARQLDPLSLIIASDNGAILYFSRQYDRAIAKWRSVLEMDPDFPRAHLVTHAYVEKRMFAEAFADLDRQRSKMAAPWYWSTLAYINGRSGRSAEARQAIRTLLDLNRQQPVDARVIAWAYTGIGDKNQTLAWLEKAYKQHSNELTALKVDPAYDWLRDDPHFQDLLRRVGLAE